MLPIWRACMQKRRPGMDLNGRWPACVWHSMVPLLAGTIACLKQAKSRSFPLLAGAEVAGFLICSTPIEAEGLREALLNEQAGAFVSFEGWVRNHHEGRTVRGLHYQANETLAVAEGAQIVQTACAKFEILDAVCAHRVGELDLGEMAVWVGVSAAHRSAAFYACRYIIDEVKENVPIWKQEHYEDGDIDWLHPE